VFEEAWGLVEARLRQGYCPLALEHAIIMEVSGTIAGSPRYDILQAALYLLHQSFPTQCVAVVPRIEAALETMLHRGIGKHAKPGNNSELSANIYLAAARILYQEVLRTRRQRPYDGRSKCSHPISPESKMSLLTYNCWR